MSLRPYTTRWTWCLITSLAMVFLSMIPQIHLWILRGRDWNGAYVSPQSDEPYYSAYTKALIDRRPRKNDPFAGRDDVSSAPMPESTFSIQFIPAYAIALPARLFHVSASTSFIVLVALFAFAATVAIFWLLQTVTADHRVAATGTLFALCVGWIVGRYGIFNTYFDIGLPALHFLRRYQPAFSFPLFFVFQLLVWKAFQSRNRRAMTLTCAFAGVALVARHLYRNVRRRNRPRPVGPTYVATDFD